MPLPTDGKEPWPPKPYGPLQRDHDEASAWYSGDPKALANFYGGAGGQQQAGSRIRFWARRQHPTNPERQRVHAPVAADVAATSADLLFGEEATLTIPEAHEESADGEAKATEDRLVELGEKLALPSLLLEGAEVCAGLGGVYLRPAWDQAVAAHPLLTVVHADQAVPEFRWGRLTAVTFWRVVHDENGQVWRHLERHETAEGHPFILHALYAGTRESIGVRRPLKAHPATLDLLDVVEVPGDVTGLAVRYVPNQLPNRKHRNTPVGRADTAGAESLMDALDETFTSWMRDIRVGQARIVVPGDFLERSGRGQGATFDVDREVFTPLDMDPSSRDNAGITPVEFVIRTEEHAGTVLALFERIVSAAGYSAQTFGLQADGGIMTATEVRAREAKSLRTKAKKQRYWAAAVEEIVQILLVIDREIFSSKVAPLRPRLDFADALVDDPKVTAETLELFNRAQAMSVETRVRMAQPELEGEELKAEVDRIRAEQGLLVPEPTGGLP